MKPSLLAISALSVALLGCTAHAQTATVIEVVSEKQAYTYTNASGFSIMNNGTLRYDGPLNSIGDSPCCTSATLTVDDVSVSITPESVQRDTKAFSTAGDGNTLSRELARAEMQVTPGINNLGLQYDVVIGGATRVKLSNSYTLQEKVDSQSLSIFPQFQPSVFP